VFAELIDNHCAFSFTYFLYDNLFRGLGGDTVKGDRFNLIFNIFAHVQTFVFEACRFQRNFFGRLSNFFYDYPTTEGIEITAFTIDFYANVDLLLIFFFVAVASALSSASKIFSRGSAFSLDTASTTAKISLFIAGFSPQSRLLKVGNQVRLLDITQREHFIFAFDCDRDHLTVHRFDNALPFTTVLYRHTKNQRDFFTQETHVVFSCEQRTVETR
jgi:hypothetical protein